LLKQIAGTGERSTSDDKSVAHDASIQTNHL